MARARPGRPRDAGRGQAGRERCLSHSGVHLLRLRVTRFSESLQRGWQREEREAWEAGWQTPGSFSCGQALQLFLGWAAASFTLHSEPYREKVAVSHSNSCNSYTLGNGEASPGSLSLVTSSARPSPGLHSPRGDKAIGLLEYGEGGPHARKGRRDSEREGGDEE